MRRLMCCLLVPLWLAAMPAMAAKSLVPKLDEEGRRGEIARINAEKARQRFAALDVDKDDRLSAAEVATILYLNDNFAKYDKDGDGSLSWTEYVGHDRWPRQAE